MKKNILRIFAPNMSFIIAFVLSMMAAYLLVSHMQHTILQAWFGMSGTTSQIEPADEEIAASPAVIASEEESTDLGCGCPFCCSI